MVALRNRLASKLQENVNTYTENMTDEELFSFAEYKEEDTEKTGYSNYSYWRSTIQSFCKNKVALF